MSSESITEVLRVADLVSETQPRWAQHLRNVCRDAQRYRWLCEDGNMQSPVALVFDSRLGPANSVDLDTVIDAEMVKAGKL